MKISCSKCGKSYDLDGTRNIDCECGQRLDVVGMDKRVDNRDNHIAAGVRKDGAAVHAHKVHDHDHRDHKCGHSRVLYWIAAINVILAILTLIARFTMYRAARANGFDDFTEFYNYQFYIWWSYICFWIFLGMALFSYATGAIISTICHCRRWLIER